MLVTYTIAVPAPVRPYDTAHSAPTSSSDGVGDGSEISGAFEIASKGAPTARGLRDAWPFEGQFHFRCKTVIDGAPVWLDMLQDDAECPCVEEDGASVCVRALPLFRVWPVPADGDSFDAPVDSYVSTAAQKSQALYGQPLKLAAFPLQSASSLTLTHTHGSSPAASDAGSVTEAGGSTSGSFWDTMTGSAAPRRASMPPTDEDASSHTHTHTSGTTGAAQAASALTGMMSGLIKGVTKAASTAAHAASAAVEAQEKKGGWFSGLSKGVSALAKAAATGVSGAAGGAAALPTGAAMNGIVALCEEYNTPFTPGVSSHDEVLARLAAAAWTPPAPPGPGDHWLSLGFTSPDPADDLRIGGLLAPRAIVYFAETYSTAFKAQVAAQADAHEDETPYHPALAMLFIADKLAASLGFRKRDDLGKEKAVFWELFVHEDAFYELFALTARYFDQEWKARPDSERRVDPIIQDAVARAHAWLQTGPQSLEQLRHAASADGVAAM